MFTYNYMLINNNFIAIFNQREGHYSILRETFCHFGKISNKFSHSFASKLQSSPVVLRIKSQLLGKLYVKSTLQSKLLATLYNLISHCCPVCLQNISHVSYLAQNELFSLELYYRGMFSAPPSHLYSFSESIRLICWGSA